ncbi:unnamed protein product [Meloidogyne enterolobii]|uniref:Uncharacterized protein n=1 Tax=Meloidogyne enterolobii TaxID=390850 RepID=A0ACB1ATM7_MELEN
MDVAVVFYATDEDTKNLGMDMTIGLEINLRVYVQETKLIMENIVIYLGLEERIKRKIS